MSDFVSQHFPHDCATAVQTANDLVHTEGSVDRVIDLTMSETISVGWQTERTMVNIVLFYHLFQMHLLCYTFTPGTLDKDSARSSSRLQVEFRQPQCSRCTLPSYFFFSLEPLTGFSCLSLKLLKRICQCVHSLRVNSPKFSRSRRRGRRCRKEQNPR